MARALGKETGSSNGRGADRSVVLLLVILAVAALLRLIDLGVTAPSQDELWSLELSTGRGSVHLQLPVNEIAAAPAMTELGGAPPWYRVWTSLDRVTHPPLYS